MKEKINAEDVSTFNRLSKALTLMMVISLLAWAPLAYFLSWWGIALSVILFAVTFWLAIREEKEKKKHDIQSYKEIVAFLEGRRLDDKQSPGSGKTPISESAAHPRQRNYRRCSNGRAALAVYRHLLNHRAEGPPNWAAKMM